MAHAQAQADRREAKRFQIALPVRLECGRAITRDMSAAGVFFEAEPASEHAFARGTPIQFAVALEHVDPEGPFHFQCKGQVVRVEGLRDRVGVAVAISAYAFDRLTA